MNRYYLTMIVQGFNYRYFGVPLILIFMIQMFLGCQTSSQIAIQEERDRGYYQNQALSLNVRDQIGESFQAVRRIQSSVIYRTYQIESVDGEFPTVEELAGVELEEIASGMTIDTHSSAGTATVLSIENRNALLITASHIVSYPDTVYHYQWSPDDGYQDQVIAVSITQTRNQFLVTDSGVTLVEILANDERRDLALLRTVSDISDSGLRVLDIPMGNPGRLDWTDVVYAVGYPRGVQMVSRGIISKSSHPIRRLTMDLSINRGFSGGLVFAVRNDGSGLEWVGNITSAMGEREVYLTPKQLYNEEYSSEIPYEGALYVQSTPRIYYGITLAVDINEATRFIRENRILLIENGFTRAVFTY